MVLFVKYLGVIFGKNITGRMLIEMTETKAFRTSLCVYSLSKNG
jgi:hypothetical protein